jgi:hypothetical protein
LFLFFGDIRPNCDLVRKENWFRKTTTNISTRKISIAQELSFEPGSQPVQDSHTSAFLPREASFPPDGPGAGEPVRTASLYVKALIVK